MLMQHCMEFNVFFNIIQQCCYNNLSSEITLYYFSIVEGLLFICDLRPLPKFLQNLIRFSSYGDTYYHPV